MTLDYDAFKFWFDLAQFAGTVVIGIYVWMSNRHRVTTERIGKLEDDMDTRLDKHGDRLSRLEVHAGAAPTHEDIGRLYQRLDKMNGELQKVTGEFSQVRHTLGLIHDHLLNGGGK